jgi:lauroyl/myristoyl acyltransferase
MLHDAVRDAIRFDAGAGLVDAGFDRLAAALSAANVETEYGQLFLPMLMNVLAVDEALRGEADARAFAAACVRSKLLQEAEFYRRIAHVLDDDRLSAEPWLLGFDKAALDQLSSRGRGVILCSARYGLCRHFAIEVALHGHDVAMAVNDVNFPYWSKLLTQTGDALRRIAARPVPRLHAVNIEVADGGRRLARALGANDVVCIMADGSTGVTGPWERAERSVVRFFGRELSVRHGIARLSAATGAPILPVLAVRERAGRGRLVVGQAIEPPTSRAAGKNPAWLADAMQCVFSFLESAIARRPEQWEGIAGLHRLLTPTDGSDSPSEADRPAVPCPVASTDVVRRRDGAPCIVTRHGDATYLVDPRRMKAYRVSASMGALVERLFRGSEPEPVSSLLASIDPPERPEVLRSLGQWIALGILSRIPVQRGGERHGDGTSRSR